MSKVKWTSERGVGIEDTRGNRHPVEKVSYFGKLLKFLKFNKIRKNITTGIRTNGRL
jgi:hypothetical protein